ncbi:MULTISPECIES: ImmA/IrrE family metallo-endopeptidase [unclassified Knoellia]|uniref:ImmA/IrrE family metallo-endopeptidase n=1 Tax=Knoellia altitudinis TaxID=3404795 RepID=UPI00361977C4
MTAEAEGKARAEHFRREHDLGHAPLSDLVALIEQTQKVDVAILDANVDEHGLVMRDPVRDDLVLFAARTPHTMRQRSTLAHELAHVLFGDRRPAQSGGWAKRSHEEIRADGFARHLLLPISALTHTFRDGRTPTLGDLSALVQAFQISPSLAAIQLHGARLITAQVKGQWMDTSTPTLAARYGWTDQYRAMQQESMTRRAPQQLLAWAVAGYTNNVVALQSLARIRGITAEQVAADLAEAAIEPVTEEIAWASLKDLPVPTDADFAELDELDDLPGPHSDLTGDDQAAD